MQQQFVGMNVLAAMHPAIRFFKKKIFNLGMLLAIGAATTGLATAMAPSVGVAAEGESAALQLGGDRPSCEDLAKRLQLPVLFEVPLSWTSRLKIAIVHGNLQPVGHAGDEVVVARTIIVASHDAAAIAETREHYATELEKTGARVELSNCEPAWGITEEGLLRLFEGLIVAEGEIGFNFQPPLVRQVKETVVVPNLPRRRPNVDLAPDVLTIEQIIKTPAEVLPLEADADVAPPLEEIVVADIPPPNRAEDFRPNADFVVPVDEDAVDLAAIDREQLASLEVEATPKLPIYKGIAALNLGLVSPGMSVLAIEKMDCSDKGNFFIGSYGTLVGSSVDSPNEQTSEPAADDPLLVVKRSSRVAGNNYFGTITNVENIAELLGSVASDGFWCLPKREFCYEQIGFRDFGAKGRAGDTIAASRGWVFSAENSLVMAFAAAVSDLCAVHPVGVAK